MLWSISLSVPKTLSTFPYLSSRLGSPSSRICCSKSGAGPKPLWAASPASPPRCPLPLLSRRIRTRPSRTALSSEANTNQPQMFTLGEKGQQMRSHSIKLASLPLSLCLSCKSAKNPGELFRSVGVTTLLSGFICLIPSSLCAVSHLGFPLKKKAFLFSNFFFFRLFFFSRYLLEVYGRVAFCWNLPSFRGMLAHLSPLYLMIKRDTTQEWNFSSKNRQEYLQVTLSKQSTGWHIIEKLVDLQK